METTLEERFNQAVEKWLEHCSQPAVLVSSRGYDVTECGAYKEVVTMGYEALPLIRRLYDRDAGIHDLPPHKFPKRIEEMSEEEIKDSHENLPLAMIKSHGLGIAVQEIIGSDFHIPEEISGKMSEIQSYTKNWLDENMHKYVQS